LQESQQAKEEEKVKMVLHGVPIPGAFIRHAPDVTGKFYGSDRKSFIREFSSFDMFQSSFCPADDADFAPLDKVAQMCYIEVIPN
jgi:hypothetical protein